MKVKTKSSVSKAVIMIKKMALCALSILILGISIAINTKTDLGTDPISVFYNGVSAASGIELGLATNTINVTLALIVFAVRRKYINIGTVIYALTLGPSITLGMYLYDIISPPDSFIIRLIVSFSACFLAFLGLGSFIATDAGIDPWSASMIILGKKFNKPFGSMMIAVNVLVLIIGYLLGGKVQITTLFTAAVGGPLIQRISEFLDKVFIKVLKFKEE